MLIAGYWSTVLPHSLQSTKVLETCVKNCGKRFHLQVAHRDFIQELLKMIGPKNEPSVFVQEKVLGLLQVKKYTALKNICLWWLSSLWLPLFDASHSISQQSWADAFRGCPELRVVEQTCIDLKQKGIEFPATDLDHMAPIHTPKVWAAWSLRFRTSFHFMTILFTVIQWLRGIR